MLEWIKASRQTPAAGFGICLFDESVPVGALPLPGKGRKNTLLKETSVQVFAHWLGGEFSLTLARQIV